MVYWGMTSNDVLAQINEALAAGRTIAFGTALRVTTFSPKTVATIRANGAEPFKLGADGALRMLSGWKNRKPVFVTVSLSNGTMLGRLTVSE